jgi:hypothetical protein
MKEALGTGPQPPGCGSTVNHSMHMGLLLKYVLEPNEQAGGGGLELAGIRPGLVGESGHQLGCIVPYPGQAPQQLHRIHRCIHQCIHYTLHQLHQGLFFYTSITKTAGLM